MIESPSSSGMLRSSTTRSGTLRFDRVAQALAAVAQRHGKAVHLEIIADHLAGRRLVIDNDDVLALGHVTTLGRGQHDGEGRSLSGAAAVGGDLAAMHVDDALDDRKAEPGRAFAGGGFCGQPLEAAEQPSEILRRQAGAFVGDADDGVVRPRGSTSTRDLAADRAVFDGVADEIVDRLPHPVGVAHGDDIRRRRHRDGLLLVDGRAAGWLRRLR